MEKTIRAVYKLGTGKILYYVEKVSGENIVLLAKQRSIFKMVMNLEMKLIM